MSLWQLAALAAPVAGVFGLWGVYQLWWAKRQGKAEQVQTDKVRALSIELEAAKVASDIDAKVAATPVDELRKQLLKRSGL